MQMTQLTTQAAADLSKVAVECVLFDEKGNPRTQTRQGIRELLRGWGVFAH